MSLHKSGTSAEMVLKENLRRLGLPAMLRECLALNRSAAEQGSSYIDYLGSLTTLEVVERTNRRIKRRISEAQFPALKPLESFDTSKAPALSAHLVRQLSACSWNNYGRYERSSTIITTNLPFPDWVEVFGAATLTSALLNRITHRCQFLEFNWSSIRFAESIQNRGISEPKRELPKPESAKEAEKQNREE